MITLRLAFSILILSLLSCEKNQQLTKKPTQKDNQIKQGLNLNYADDGKEYHNLDIHLPKVAKPAYKAIIVIYGSAWYGDNLKQAAFDALGKPLLDSGFAVMAINHRSS